MAPLKGNFYTIGEIVANGITFECIKVVPEHAPVAMVRLNTYYSDYGTFGSTLQ